MGPWPLGRNYVIITWTRAQTKINSSNAFQIRIFLFRSYSFGIERITSFIRYCIPTKTVPDSRPKLAYPFSDQTGPKTIPFRVAHTYMAYIREYSHGKLSYFIEINSGSCDWITDACLNEFQMRDMCGDSQVERTTAPKPKEEFTGMMGNLARALDERHKVMHSSGKPQDTTAQSMRSYNHTLQLKHASTPPER